MIDVINTTPAIPRINKMALFNTPESWKVLEDWIERHPLEERAHLWTAAGMAWNLAVEFHDEILRTVTKNG